MLVSTEAGGPPQTRSTEQKMLVDRGTQSCLTGSNTRLCWIQIVFPSCKKVVDKQWKPGCRKLKDQYNILQVTRCLGLVTQRHTIQGKMSTKKLLLDAKPPSRTRRCLCVCWCVLSVMHVKLCVCLLRFGKLHIYSLPSTCSTEIWGPMKCRCWDCFFCCLWIKKDLPY